MKPKFQNNPEGFWPQSENVPTQVFALYHYFSDKLLNKYRYNGPLTRDYLSDQHRVHAFKADLEKGVMNGLSREQVIQKHKEAVNFLLPKLEKVYNHYIGMKDVVFVCAPASTKDRNEIRFKDFSEQFCSLTGMINGYSHIHIVSDRDPAHTNGKVKETCNYTIDEEFFRGKDVVLFDDIIKNGEQKSDIIDMFSKCGSNVIACFVIGKSVYGIYAKAHPDEFKLNPIDRFERISSSSGKVHMIEKKECGLVSCDLRNSKDKKFLNQYMFRSIDPYDFNGIRITRIER